MKFTDTVSTLGVILKEQVAVKLYPLFGLIIAKPTENQKNQMKKAHKILMVLLLAAGSLFASVDIYSEISDAIRSGDARAVAKYFSSTVDLTILRQEEVYSKAQAEQVLRDFFSKNTPRSFALIHKGVSKEGAKYAIGNLVTTQGAEYRTYFFVKQTAAGEVIQELRFEKQ